MTYIGPYTNPNTLDPIILPDSTEGDKKCRGRGNTILDYISNHPGYKIVRSMIKTSGLESFYEGENNITLFIPQDMNYSQLLIPDKFESIRLLRRSTTDFRADSLAYQSSPVLYLIPQDKMNKILVENFKNSTFLNKKVQIVRPDIILSNGIIHETNGFL